MTSAEFSHSKSEPHCESNMLSKTSASALPPHLLSALFTSLSRPSRPWRLTRTLRSDNPAEINGQLTGTATFTPLSRGSTTSTEDGDPAGARDMLYREEGEMPGTVIRGMAGLRWTKKYIWRLQEDDAEISVWFVKVGGPKAKAQPTQNQNQNQEPEDEADYLFHEFEFSAETETDAVSSKEQNQDPSSESALVTPPTPPLPTSTSSTTTVLTARGNHLCINDMYRTAYSFRIIPETGEVLSWASRHVVKGPKKDQDIVNLYSLE